MKYVVTCTCIYNGFIEVDANDREEAVRMARERLDEVDWVFGEQTVDYAEEIE